MSDILRKKARELIQTGRLPRSTPDRMWGGSGQRGQCALCAAPVTPGQLVYEVEFAQDVGTTLYHFHMPCFTAMEVERRLDELARGAALPEHAQPTGGFADRVLRRQEEGS